MSAITTTLDLVKKAQGNPSEEIAKAAGFLQSSVATSGLTAYSLEAPAKTLYPVLTPLRNEIPRVSGGVGIQANWRAVTGINTAGMRLGVSEGNRGAAIEHTTADYLAAFKGCGLEDFVTFESDYAGRGFDDVKARATEGLLRSVMIGEEALIVGGNATLDLGTSGVCPTPTVTAQADTTSGVTQGTLGVKAVALSPIAYQQLAGFINGATGQKLDLSSAEPGTVARFTKTNADSSTDAYDGGVSQISSAGTATIDATHQSAKASLTPVAGAAGYAWYASVNGGTYYLYAITTVANITIAADPVNTYAVPHANLSARHDKCALEFDGLIAQACKAGSGAYVKAFAAGAQLTTDGAGGCAELNTMFQDRWNLYRLSIDEIWMNAQQLLDLNSLVVKNGGAPLIRYTLDANGQAAIDAGVAIATVLNKITNTRVTVKVHPNIPPGLILGRATQIPYKLSGIGNVVQMLLRQDYYQLEWPRKSRKYEYGVYFDGVLQNYFPPSLAVFFNITPGIA